jgi:hypothetical protein
LKSGPQVLSGEEEETANTLKSNCILDTTKLLKTGVKLRPLSEAFEDCLDRLRLTSRTARTFDAVSRYPALAYH